MAPIIGITAGRLRSETNITRISLIDKYVQAVQLAGGIPVILPTGMNAYEIQACTSKFDGFMITGGGDIARERFDGDPNPGISDVDPERDELEIQLTRLAFQQDKALLGICRGHQVINVALGGSLHTDIASQVSGALRHDWYPAIPRDYEAHPVRVIVASRLQSILNTDEINVNSLHHQAVKTIGSNLQPTAFAPDGIIEALESPDHRFFLGVQWHPEWMLATPAMAEIFRRFVASAQEPA